MRLFQSLSWLAFVIVIAVAINLPGGTISFAGASTEVPTSTSTLTPLSITLEDDHITIAPLNVLERAQVTQLVWSPDGRTLGVAGLQGVQLYEANTLTPLPNQLIQQDTRVRRLAFSPDGKFLVTATGDQQAIQPNKMQLWNVTTGTQKLIFQERANIPYEGIAYSLAFSPDGTMVAVGDWGNLVRIWNTDTGLLKISLAGHTQPVWSVAFNSSGTVLASGSADGTIRLWDIRSQSQITVLQSSSDNVQSVAFAPNGKLVVVGSQDGTIQFWHLQDIHAPRKIATIRHHTDLVYSLAFNPSGTLLVSASADGSMRLWDVDSLQEIAVITDNNGNVNSIAFSPDGTRLASGDDSSVRLWSVSTHF